MDFKIPPGKYIVAVSGGVDSMVLLDLLVRQDGLTLVVAHFDHGIRSDSGQDREVVARAAAQHGLPFVYEEGKLGPSASEAVARAARYGFLERVRVGRHANAILLAHHQDDMLETAIMNMIRGTGRRGLSSLASTTTRLRPLLHLPKAEILTYAQQHDLVWREDSTNTDERYMRNYIRHRILPRFNPTARMQLLEMINKAAALNQEIDMLIEEWLSVWAPGTTLHRGEFIMLPHRVAKEVLAAWLRRYGIASYDTKTLERVTIAAKVQRSGSQIPVTAGAFVQVKSTVLALSLRER